MVEVFGPIVDDPGQRLGEMLRDISADSTVELRYIGVTSFNEQLDDRLQRGDRPGVALLPQPGLLGDLADRGVLRPLPPDVADSTRSQYPAGLVDLVTVGGAPAASVAQHRRQGPRLVPAGGVRRTRPRGAHDARRTGGALRDDPHGRRRRSLVPDHGSRSVDRLGRHGLDRELRGPPVGPRSVRPLDRRLLAVRQSGHHGRLRRGRRSPPPARRRRRWRPIDPDHPVGADRRHCCSPSPPPA